jgi:hypothetical protein
MERDPPSERPRYSGAGHKPYFTAEFAGKRRSIFRGTRRWIRELFSVDIFQRVPRKLCFLIQNAVEIT